MKVRWGRLFRGVSALILACLGALSIWCSLAPPMINDSGKLRAFHDWREHPSPETEATWNRESLRVQRTAERFMLIELVLGLGFILGALPLAGSAFRRGP